ncbi:MAG TPA: YchJ family metal-binding protein [Asanoa sp.]|nr:YchJ family metal-binding protein [Asanoa sp.]
MAKRACPCGSGLDYDECCGPLHRGADAAPTAERLMRSRFSAFALGEVGYLLRTWHSTTRPESLDLDPAQRWTRLEVLDTAKGGPSDPTGIVEFRAVYRQAGRTDALHERSRFVHEDGVWVYVGPLPLR